MFLATAGVFRSWLLLEDKKMDQNYGSTLRSIGEIVLMLALFLGLGYYVYTALFTGPNNLGASTATTEQVQQPPKK